MHTVWWLETLVDTCLEWTFFLSSVCSFWKSSTSGSTAGPPALQLEFPLLSVTNSVEWYLIVPFLVSEDMKENMEWGISNRWVEKVFFAMFKTELCLTGDRKYGLEGLKRVGVRELHYMSCLCSKSLYKTCDIPLGEVSIAVLQCGLKKSWHITSPLDHVHPDFSIAELLDWLS